MLLALAFSLLYTGGMYLNDAFDREIDAARAARAPDSRRGASPRGPCSSVGFALLAAGVVVVGRRGAVESGGPAAAWAGAAPRAA